MPFIPKQQKFKSIHHTEMFRLRQEALSLTLDLQNISPIVNPEPLFEQPHANPENGNGVGIVRVLQGSNTVPTITTILVEHVFSFAPKSGVGKLEIRVSIFFKAFHVPMMI